MIVQNNMISIGDNGKTNFGKGELRLIHFEMVIKKDKNWQRLSASLNFDFINFGNHADARPAVGFHLVVVFHAGEVGDHVGSSGLGGLLTNWVGGSDIIDTGDLLGFWALFLGGSKSDQGSECEKEFHLDQQIIINLCMHDVESIQSFIQINYFFQYLLFNSINIFIQQNTSYSKVRLEKSSNYNNKMYQSKFSNSILLVGMTLIFYNTASMIANIVFEFTLLIASLVWSVIKIIPNAIINYPITLLCVGFGLYFNKGIILKLKNTRLTSLILYKVLGGKKECCVCLKQKVDLLLLECGHFYHKNCVEVYLEQHSACPLCNTKVQNIKSNDSTKTELSLIKSTITRNKKTIMITLAITFLIGLIYSQWWSQVTFFN